MSGRNIPIAMVPNLEDAAPRWCFLWKIMPTTPQVPLLGLTNWDVDKDFDDGDGVVTYKARRGYNSYAIQSTADLAVDNSEMEILIAEFDVDGITGDAIRRGSYDDAKFIQYMINPEDIPAGYAIVNSGSIGRLANIDGLTGVLEARSLTQIIKQKSIIEKGSNNCRVVELGDERCKIDVNALWDGGEVDTVGVETDREFTIMGSGISEETDFYRPGLVKFLAGANAGRSYEVESYEVLSNGMTVVLAIPTEEAIAPGDELEIRPDCTRLWEGHNSCGPEKYNNRPNYRGEPWRPVSETEQLMAPGAGSNSIATALDDAVNP